MSASDIDTRRRAHKSRRRPVDRSVDVGSEIGSSDNVRNKIAQSDPDLRNAATYASGGKIHLKCCIGNIRALRTCVNVSYGEDVAAKCPARGNAYRTKCFRARTGGERLDRSVHVCSKLFEASSQDLIQFGRESCPDGKIHGIRSDIECRILIRNLNRGLPRSVLTAVEAGVALRCEVLQISSLPL